MNTRICCRCHIEKPLTEFHKDVSRPLGKSYRCKECACALQRIRGRVSDKRPDRIAKSKAWLKSERGKKLLRMKAREDYQKNKAKYAAQRTVHRLISKGVIVKKPCKQCGDTNSGAHHPDYSKPVEVVWLCQKHHSEQHRK